MKLIATILLGIAVILLVISAWVFYQMAPVIAGFGAKSLCSCVYVGGRTTESVLANELASFPISIGTFELDQEDSSAYGAVFGLLKAKAIFRKGLGCTLIRELTEFEIRARLPGLDIKRPVLSDTLAWPIGSGTIGSIPNEIDYTALHHVLINIFEDKGAAHDMNTRAIVVIYKGKLIAETYADGFDKNSVFTGWSMTKSMTNAMLGVMVRQERLNIYEPANVPEWSASNDPRRKITIDQLLRMSSGLHWEENYTKSSNATNMLYKKANMGLEAIIQPLQYNPDEMWYYSSGTSNLLSRLIRHTLGDTRYYQFPYIEIFYKLGMRTAVIETDASGTFTGSSYMWASARDWARLGLLYLNDGIWNSSRILPDDWVDYSTTPTPKAPMGEFGAHFWLNAGETDVPENRSWPDVPEDTYSMNGYEGQRVIIIPSVNMVIVRLGQTAADDVDFNELISRIIGCVDFESR